MGDKKENKVLYIQSSEHAIIGRSGSPAETVEPGGRVLLDEDVESHKFLKAQIEAGAEGYEHLSLVEVDPKAEKAQKEEFDKQQEKAAKIAAKARDEQLQADAGEAADEDNESSVSQVEDATLPPQDQEAVELAKQSGAGQRASTQEDTVEEHSAKSGRRSTRKG